MNPAATVAVTAHAHQIICAMVTQEILTTFTKRRTHDTKSPRPIQWYRWLFLRC